MSFLYKRFFFLKLDVRTYYMNYPQCNEEDCFCTFYERCLNQDVKLYILSISPKLELLFCLPSATDLSFHFL